MKQLHKTLW